MITVNDTPEFRQLHTTSYSGTLKLNKSILYKSIKFTPVFLRDIKEDSTKNLSLLRDCLVKIMRAVLYTAF
ncbi:MAG TPA: hypothetical protein VFW07_12140 [Parafilimonas sp.]|nr:hypothetical protein [Parafilimonas sp.]